MYLRGFAFTGDPQKGTRKMNGALAITSPDAKFNEDKLYYFKKTVVLEHPKKALVHITADARYKLWVNGQMVSFGPYKSSGHTRYFHSVDIGPYLKHGENTLFVEVLQLSATQDFAKYRFLNAVIRSGNLGWLLWGQVDDTTLLRTDETWQCAQAPVTFLPPQYAYFCGVGEYVQCEPLVWKNAAAVKIYDPQLYYKSNDYGEICLWDLKECDLPAQKYDLQPLCTRDAAGTYDFGRIVTGFVRIKAKGRGQIKLTYAESYVFNDNGKTIKADRTDIKGEILGDWDIFQVDGACCHETFWFRTFRFIKVEGDAELDTITVAETGYPLQVAPDYDFGSETDNRLWEICINSLKCCMHETYEDCPYYEQLQYAMDTYLQMLFHMRLTEDTALVKRGIRDFAASVSGADITMSRFPVSTPQYILGFSLFIVFMLDALERNRGEHSFIKQYLGTVDLIVAAFEKRKRPDGLLGKGKDWSFVDWAQGWERGVPPSKAADALTVYNLMYAVTLEKAARLCKIFGRNDTAEEYLSNAAQLKRLVKEKCYCTRRGLYADTDRKETFSQHAQIWAVLAELEDMETGKRLMEESLSLTAKGGFAYAYFLFRALEKVDAYALSEDLMAQYRGLLELHCTTVPEEPDNPRSECHAWGAVLINEFTTVVLGVKENDDGVMVKPYTEGRSHAKGTVHTKCGPVGVCWTRCDGTFNLRVQAPENVKITAYLPDGTQVAAVGTLLYP